jgi:sugar phosphate isomerase/epimerase
MTVATEDTNMFKNLSPGAIGIREISLPDAIELARRTGFSGIDFSIGEAADLADAHGVGYVRGLFQDAGIVPGQWGLPVAWNNEEQWTQDMTELPHLALLGRELGCTRTATWCPSWSDERDYEDNWTWHVARFRPIAEVLMQHDCRLGIEFLGPKTLRSPHRYGFIHTLQEMMSLAAEIGTGNVGLLLDVWHLYTSGGSIDDLDTITAKDIVTVHISDAPAGIPRDEQRDTIRCLPMETGVIDLAGFIGKLAGMGYDGPVTTEPFNERINTIAAEDPDRAAREVSEIMDNLWSDAPERR